MDVFSTAFGERLIDVGKLRDDIQALKGFLFHREFDKAFGDEDALEAYSVRWSAVRAVAYAGLFMEAGCLGEGLRVRAGQGGKERRKVVCLGGGAGAEVVALGAMGRWGGSGQDGEERDYGSNGEDGDMDGGRNDGLEVMVVDIAPWSSVLSKLSSSITTPPIPTLPESSQHIQEPLAPQGKLAVTFKQCDIFSMQHQEMQDLCHEAKLVTLMFTLNELYSISIAKTTKMLLDLTEYVERGCMIVVADSPGSYSTLALNGGKDEKEKDGASKDDEKEREKRYPMKWLLDHTLLEVASDEGRSTTGGGGGKGEGTKQWEKVYSEDSRWFRLREELRYPIALEDMRMQVHVYRRL